VADTVALKGMDEDERRLAELGYKQELNRSWSGFSNFAISFSIISILAGCFTTFGVGWNNGGPAAIAWGWPIVALFILVIGLCMSELVSAFPTSGGIYWWASKLGGVKAGYYTGWLNLIGLLAIDASVAYGCATFFDLTLGFFDSGYTSGNLNRIFLYFFIVLALAAAVNIFSSHLLAILNNVSVWWHVIGAAAVVLILWIAPAHHASVSSVFTHTVNNTGFFGGHTGGAAFLFGVLPLSFILTQYTITGYDASAHLSEETHSAADSAAKGIWRSIFYSGIGGWIVLLAFLFAVQDEAGVSSGGGGVAVIFGQALTPNWGGLVLVISTAGQFFCTVACMTSTTRMLFAFSRDGAVPGAKYWSRLNHNKVPVYGVLASAVVALVLTSPALVKVDINGAPVPVAFFAVVSIGVIGLYVAFAIPIYLRWRAGDNFTPGGWTLGNKYKWMAPIAVAEIAITSFIAILPTSSLGAPWYKGFGWSSLKFVNYTPIVVFGALILLWAGWHLTAKHWFTGPKITIDLPEGMTSADEIRARAPEVPRDPRLPGRHRRLTPSRNNGGRAAAAARPPCSGLTPAPSG
jgi:amino acid transporter